MLGITLSIGSSENIGIQPFNSDEKKEKFPRVA